VTAYINDAEVRNAPDTRAWRRGWGAPILLLTSLVFLILDQEPATRQGDRKIKRPFPPTASAHPMPPCCHPARCCPRLGSARTPRASGWPALDAAGRPLARTAAHGQAGWLGTGSLHGWSCSGGGCSGVLTHPLFPHSRNSRVIRPISHSFPHPSLHPPYPHISACFRPWRAYLPLWRPPRPFWSAKSVFV
jgi:hypothetical protein